MTEEAEPLRDVGHSIEVKGVTVQDALRLIKVRGGMAMGRHCGGFNGNNSWWIIIIIILLFFFMEDDTSIS